jgi:hypothetical protein
LGRTQATEAEHARANTQRKRGKELRAQTARTEKGSRKGEREAERKLKTREGQCRAEHLAGGVDLELSKRLAIFKQLPRVNHLELIYRTQLFFF